MPVPKVVPQENITINGQRATDLGRAPRICKAWRESMPEPPPPPMTDEELQAERARLMDLRLSGKAVKEDRDRFHAMNAEAKRRGLA